MRHPLASFALAATLCSATSLATAGEMIPFVLPYDDASPGITDFSHLNHIPAGRYGFITATEEGHLQAGGARVRFLGVNVTADSCFPTHEHAEKIAGRLAKFGINIVRFHHMDNNWGSGSIIDYSKGNSRSLHAGNLERLDYFIAQLKARGIYANINLINSREFLPSDGLDAGVTGLDWKARHILGFVDDTFRDLEKEFATQLLTHVNPYTGLSYAEDPAIAVVEVNNENGIFQQYFDGNIDLWPAVYKEQLQDGWNTWLQERYADTEAMLEAWSGDSEPLGAELIANGDFSEGTTSWNIEEHQGAEVTATVGAFSGRQGVRLDITTTSDTGWHVQVNQGGKALTKDQLYTLSFRARADTERTFDAGIGLAYAPYSSAHSFSGLTATADWQEFTFVFNANVSDTNLRLNFGNFVQQSGPLYLADISLRPGGDLSASLPEGQSLEAANVALNARSESYLPNRVLDWTRYLTEVALDYWTDMRDHIKDTIGYDGLVNGTTIMNSPPNIQGVFDLADTHAYWQHPVFPGTAWDPNDWYVNPVSMVNTLDNTIADLSRQRIDGYPHTVSEYRHSYPNPFASEGPLLIAAYGALQDWDGIYFFDYARGNSWDQGYFDNYFNMNHHPSDMANTAIAANLFRRGDIDAATAELLMHFSPEREIEAVATRGRSWNIGDGRQLDIQPEHALVQRVALSIGDNAEGLMEPPAAPAGPVYEATNDQLVWNMSVAEKGVVTVDSDRTKAAIGFINGRSFALGNVSIEFGATQEDWATVALTMQEGSFAYPTSGGSLLIVATGLTENTDMVWTDDTKSSVGSNWGVSPSRVEAIPASITLPYSAERVQAWALDETGQRGDAMSVTADGDRAVIEIGAAWKSLWYEVQIEASVPPYQAWMLQNFSEEQQGNEEISGPLADPDEDSFPNLLEFLAHAQPLVADEHPPIEQTIEWHDKRPVFVYHFRINPAFPVENIDLLQSPDLAKWSSVDVNVTGAQVTLRLAPATYPAFSRLRATTP